MTNVFAELGLDAWDFLQISVSFLLTMLIFFGVKDKKYGWLNTLCLLTLGLQCGLLVIFRTRLPVKLFAVLLLMTTLIVELAINRRKKLRRV